MDTAYKHAYEAGTTTTFYQFPSLSLSSLHFHFPAKLNNTGEKEREEGKVVAVHLLPIINSQIVPCQVSLKPLKKFQDFNKVAASKGNKAAYAPCPYHRT